MTDTREQVYEFCKIWRELTNLYGTCARAVEMPFSSLYVLYIIYANNETCTQKMICEETFYPKQTVNAIIRGFWKDGFIRQTEISTDRRTKTIHLTESGKAFAETIIPKIDQAETRAMEKLTEAQRRELIQSLNLYLQKFRQCLGEFFDIKKIQHRGEKNTTTKSDL